jgi:hypothetical protein
LLVNVTVVTVITIQFFLLSGAGLKLTKFLRALDLETVINYYTLEKLKCARAKTDTMILHKFVSKTHVKR